MLLACACVAGGGAAGAATEPAQADGSAGEIPRAASAQLIADAEPLYPILSGIAAGHPDACADVLASEPTRTRRAESVRGDQFDLLPPMVEITNPSPGTSYRGCFSLHNRSSLRSEFAFEAVDIAGSLDPDAKQEILPPSVVGSWIRPEVARVTLDPEEIITIPYVLEIPAERLGGSVSGGLVIRRVQQEPASTGAGFSISLLYRVSVQFPGGTSKPLVVEDVNSPRVLARAAGRNAFSLRFVTRNEGEVVETYEATLAMSGLLGVSIASTKRAPSILLPNSAERVLLYNDDLPWIGLYRPKLVLESKEHTVTEQLPLLLVLPSKPVTGLILLALAMPVVALLVRWRRRRLEWQQYLDEDYDDYEAEFPTQP